MVEIARNLIGDCRVLILDEPTAMLTAREVELLFEQIDRLKARGVAIVYISHRLEELARVAERVAVLRDGRLVHVGDMAAISADGLVTLMVGRELGEHRSRRAPDRAPRLVVSGMTRHGRAGRVARSARRRDLRHLRADRRGAHRIAADLRRGHARYGHDRGRRAAAAGAHPVAGRRGRARHRADHRGPQGRRAAAHAIGRLQRVARPARRLARGGVVDTARETALAEQQIDALRIRTHGAAQPVGELSGGNQQKVVIGRWLARDMGVLLFDEPTRGIDVGAKFEIYTLMGALARDGARWWSYRATCAS
jgi:ribose transport system ATP-binding protein